MLIIQKHIILTVLISSITYFHLNSTLFAIDNFNTITICSAIRTQKEVQMISDGSGGAILIWLDSRISRLNHYGRGYYDIYAQRINSKGSTLWESNGVSVATAIDFEGTDFGIGLNQKIVNDGVGGVIIGWVQSGENNNRDIYAQHINKDGLILWQGNGIPICNAPYMQWNLDMISDNAGGAILAWKDFREIPNREYPMLSNNGIYAQRVNSQGSTLWHYNGIHICKSPQVDIPRLVSDGKEGAIISWLGGPDKDNNPYIFAQRVSSYGSTLWTLEGVAICTVMGRKFSVSMISDGKEGALISWTYDPHSLSQTIYAQYINCVGSTLWQMNGIPVSDSNQLGWGHYAITNSDDSNILFIWREKSSPSQWALYAQKVNKNGSLLWPNKGIEIYCNYGLLAEPQTVSDGSGGTVIVSWGYTKGNYKDDIYLQRIDDKGNVLWNINSLIPDTTFRFQYNPKIVLLNHHKVLIGWHGGKSWDYDIYANIIDIDNPNLQTSTSPSQAINIYDPINGTTSDGVWRRGP